MTKKHYKAIAQVIKNSTIIFKSMNKQVINKNELINDLCDIFKQDNNRFDYDRFINACD